MAELGRLTAVFDADTARFDAGIRHADRGIQSLTTRTQVWSRAFGQAFSSAAPQVSQFAGSINSITAGAGGMVGALGAATIGVGAFTAVVISAARGVYELASSAAATSDRLGDMADKVNFSVRTISGLSPAIESSGGSLEGFNNALGIFDKNIEKVAQGDERLSKLFKGLKIDATDNEAAFRQVADVLVKLGGTSQQTALAMELFGRSGKDVLGVIKAADGNVEEFIKRMEELGVVITDDAVRAADAFDKQMIVTKAQLATVTRQLGEEFMPMVQEAASNLSTNLKNNQGEIRRTIKEIGNLVQAVASMVQYFKLVSPIALVTEIIVKTIFTKSDNAPQPTTVVPGSVYGVGPLTMRTAPQQARALPPNAGMGGSSALADRATREPDSPDKAFADYIRNLLNRGSGGGGGGGRGGSSRSDPAADMKKMADIQLRILLEGLQREEDDIERSYDRRRLTVETYHRAISRLEQNRHQSVMESLQSEEDAIKSSKKLTDTEKKIALQDLELNRMEEANRHRREANRLDDTILQLTRERVVSMERLVALQTRPRRAGEDIGGVTRPRRAEEDIGGITRPRIATDLEQSRREQYREHLDRMRELAYSLTGLIDRAIYDGWKGGLLGALDLFRNVFMRQLEDLLTNLFANISKPGKGGLISGIFNTILGAFGAGFGGGGGAGGLGSSLAGAIGRDQGGPIWPNQLYKVHKDEMIVPTAPGFVIPKGGMGQTVVNNHYTIQLPPDARGSYSSPKSKRQLSETLLAAIQASRT